MLSSPKRHNAMKARDNGRGKYFSFIYPYIRILAILAMMEKSSAFAINHASVDGFRAIGGGHMAASKAFSFLGLSLIKIWHAAYHPSDSYCYCKMIPLW